MLEAGGLVPVRAPPLRRRSGGRALHPGFPRFLHLPWRLLYCARLMLRLPRHRTLESLLSSQSPPGSKCASIPPKLLKDLSRGCAENPWSLCLASHCCEGPSSLLCKHLPSWISCSWVTCNGGFTFIDHFRAWGAVTDT